jgi:hypothetical protein
MKHLVTAVILIAAAVSLSAQTADELDKLLETPELSFAQASRFVLAQADVSGGEFAQNSAQATEAAFVLARERGWVRGSADASIRLGELCFLIMNAFDIRGSLLYVLFPGPRYAFRELDYLGLVPGRPDPALTLSGDELLRILMLVTAYTEETGAKAGRP